MRDSYKTIYRALVLSLVLSALYALRVPLEAYIDSTWMGDLAAYVDMACNASTLFNSLLLVAIVATAFIVGKAIYCGKGSVTRCIGYGFLIVYLFTNTHWHFPKMIVLGGSYRSLLILALMEMLVLETIALAKRWGGSTDASNDFQDDKKGFCMDAVYAEPKQTGWESYIEQMIKLMPEVRLQQESLAIGIAGHWGSGKSTFLRQMQAQMNKEEYRTVCFNPWTCTDKAQIVTQFFALLQEQVLADEGHFYRDLEQYRDMVLNMEIHPVLTNLAKLLPLRKETATIASLRGRIERALVGESDKPFAIFIDDLDRLEGDELFEVLRLIRVTANFRHVVFVVAYDRGYVSHVLNESKNMDRAEEYLQKIFHLEVTLPKYEEDTLLDVFIEETARIAALGSRNTVQLRRALVDLLDAEGMRFIDFIPNFRQARRFANLFALNLRAVLAHTQNIIIRDFLGIELIHFVYPTIYDTLSHHPFSLLKSYANSLRKHSLLVYESDEDTPCAKLLKRLFSENNITAKTSREIRSQISYANYFCYRLPKNSVGAIEFEMVMMSEEVETVREEIGKWLQIKDSFDSLYHHFLSYYMHEYKDVKVIRNFICALLEFLPRLSEHGIRQIASDRYWIRTGVNENELRQQLLPLFEYAIEQGKHLKKINQLLTALYTPYQDDIDSEDTAVDLFEYTQLTALAAKSLDQYIKQNGKPSPEEVSATKSAFHSFLLSASHVESYYVTGGEAEAVYSNLMSEELIKLYQNTSADIACFRQFIKPYQFTSDHPDEQEFEARGINESIQSIYGGYRIFEAFVKGAFAQAPEVDKQLKNIENIMS